MEVQLQGQAERMEHWSDFFPLIFLPFKLIVLGIGMFFAIKWHVDRDNQEREKRRQRERPKL
ncbi:hypothetical protein Q4511_13755 [Paracoccus sp. 1_MG-2023]|uniref:hypothetical protein n=1 Tax=unclassified Paracoccus (in: a-proteobacteria) TaxID=2688777 RepID=UPI001C096112|nr:MULTISPECIES: hypothetical protein [unclassified Paracoccus (in: a-proteobacteria)]MBU2958917.1 hypothetical protein [Paracoccus sp. C2R09]MDO6669993.1 hypothetical protein [Paracoccus sp. 1_MG-2023]